MFKGLVARVIAAGLLLAAGNAQAAFHLWRIDEIYSNASGTVQYIELTALNGGQQFLNGTTLTSTNGTTKTFTFPANLPGDTSGRKMLLGTSGFAALNVVTPDYTIPNGFLFIPGGTLVFAGGADTLNYASIPTDGVLSFIRGGTTATNSPTNFAGISGTIVPSPPGAPTITSVIRDNAQAGVIFTPPGSDGGATITSYTASCVGGGTFTGMASASPIVVSGLTNGTTYSCTVTATNSAGTGPASNALTVTPATFPDPPIFDSGIVGDGQITALFSPPASNGGSPISSYTVQCAALMFPTAINTGLSSPITATGMTNGVTYACRVQATNSVGTGVLSNIISLTPSAAAPLALTGVNSRKTHGAAGTFDVPITTGIPVTGPVTVEPRASNDGHTIVFEFNQAIGSFGTVSVTDAASTPIGNASAVTSGKTVVVTLSGLPDNQRATVAITGINGSLDISAAMGFLVGDINNTGSVNASDIVAVKSSIGKTITLQNFRIDVNASGAISPGDVPAVKARAGKTLQ
ncbi:MAG: hypothetical protein JNN20_08435 [Betaproteobacteria bacterium]|nr:hypothetical protein [Betaproteobacteria bacterium]